MDYSSPAIRSNKQTKFNLQKAFFLVPLLELHFSISFALELPCKLYYACDTILALADNEKHPENPWHSFLAAAL